MKLNYHDLILVVTEATEIDHKNVLLHTWVWNPWVLRDLFQLLWSLDKAKKIHTTQYNATACRGLVVYICIFGHSCIFIFLSLESDQNAIRARLGAAGLLSITPK